VTVIPRRIFRQYRKRFLRRLRGWSSVCTPEKPAGWTIQYQHFEITGDPTRSCGGGWTHCEPKEPVTEKRACYRFQTQGHAEECGHSGNTWSCTELFPSACARVGAWLPSRFGYLALGRVSAEEIALIVGCSGGWALRAGTARRGRWRKTAVFAGWRQGETSVRLEVV